MEEEEPEENAVAESEDPEEGLSSCFATCGFYFLTLYSNTACPLGLKCARRASHCTLSYLTPDLLSNNTNLVTNVSRAEDFELARKTLRSTHFGMIEIIFNAISPYRR